MGGKFGGEWIRACVLLSPLTVHLKLSQHCLFISCGGVQSLGPVWLYSLWPYGLQHTRLLCPSPSPAVCSDSCPWSQWCHPTISSSVSPFSSCPQSFPASGSFPMSQHFASGGQSTGAPASASATPQYKIRSLKKKKDQLSKAGNMGSVSGWGTKISYAVGQLSPHMATREAHVA